ncbi:MAG TPA: LacI family DNA-binding transcriptional regulator [Streptosporangiaceae bacterium]
MAVTIREVADAAGVSTATVSRALSGVQTVDPELVERVRQSADRLGYRANRVARALRRQSTQTVGLVVPDITDPFYPAVVRAIERELRRAGLSLLLCDSGNDPEVEAELLRNLYDHQVDGLLVSACDRTASRPAVQLAASRTPLLQIDQRAVAELPYVGVEQADAMRQVVEHLLGQGCRSFGYLGARPETSAGQERLDGFLAHAKQADPAAADRVQLGDVSVAWGYEATARLLEAGPAPEAIVCGSDLAAIGALQALRERGVSVPADVAVTGFDDTVLAVACDPPLTSVRQPLEELGTQAVQELTAAIEAHLPQPRSVLLNADLAVRESSRRSPQAG